MNEQFGTVDQNSKTEVRHGAKPGAFLLMERGSCSPREAVALSALAGVRWLRNRLRNLRRRMAYPGPHEKTSEKSSAKTYVVRRTIGCCTLVLAFALSCVALHASTARFLTNLRLQNPGVAHLRYSALGQK